ncbi:MAG: hypothetical protein DRR16_32555 [Candidatus Parabeggiatoa sp. nov. 3]|nr:MAG: hypothetical protein DRR00_00575 [Gammaproteobacteria bacterium]RKZ59293.1 MAG: hypothetical protein DRQ99_23975 [Gammaproteobacteria bacterium]RKZ73986.1 MAG: hypothetical protein DRR16_32555 [Gammaproteobacteria bacterium]
MSIALNVKSITFSMRSLASLNYARENPFSEVFSFSRIYKCALYSLNIAIAFIKVALLNKTWVTFLERFDSHLPF